MMYNFSCSQSRQYPFLLSLYFEMFYYTSIILVDLHIIDRRILVLNRTVAFGL